MSKRKTAAEWALMRHRYVSCGTDLKQLAIENDLSPATVYGRAAREGWRFQREAYYAEVGEVAGHICARRDGQKLASLMDVSDRLDGMLVGVCEDLRDKGHGIKELKDLTGTLKDAIAIKRDLWSIPKEQISEESITVRMELPEEFTA